MGNLSPLLQYLSILTCFFLPFPQTVMALQSRSVVGVPGLRMNWSRVHEDQGMQVPAFSVPENVFEAHGEQLRSELVVAGTETRVPAAQTCSA